MVQKEELSVLPVVLEGQWSELPKREWRGIAKAAEELVAVVFLKDGNIVEWCKSSRQTKEELEVGFSLLPYDASLIEVQVLFSVGGGDRRLASKVKSFDYLPIVNNYYGSRTGETLEFTAVEGVIRIDLSVLFLARRDVKYGRNGLWHIKPKIGSSLPKELNTILSYGRTGVIDT